MVRGLGFWLVISECARNPYAPIPKPPFVLMLGLMVCRFQGLHAIFARCHGSAAFTHAMCARMLSLGFRGLGFKFKVLGFAVL